MELIPQFGLSDKEFVNSVIAEWDIYIEEFALDRFDHVYYLGVTANVEEIIDYFEAVKQDGENVLYRSLYFSDSCVDPKYKSVRYSVCIYDPETLETANNVYVASWDSNNLAENEIALWVENSKSRLC